MLEYEPYIESLRFRVDILDTYVYASPPRLEFTNSIARFELADGELLVFPLRDYRTEAEARMAVQPTIDAWEALSDLDRSVGEFRLTFVASALKYRKPLQGLRSAIASCWQMARSVGR
jgi:hypothetical protein